MKLFTLAPLDSSALGTDLFSAFVSLRDRLYEHDYYHYPEGPSHKALLTHYAGRKDYRLGLILAEDDGTPCARVLVGAAEGYPYAFVGFFEGPNDQATFKLIMDAAVSMAQSLGKTELRGPINLNAMHDWMFLVEKTDSERWIGDPYHAPYHPELFENYGFTAVETSFSGILEENYQAEVLAMYETVRQEHERSGLEIKLLGEFDLEATFPRLYELINLSFDEGKHGYVPAPFALFKAQYAPFFAKLHDPYSLMTFWRDGAPIAFALSYANFIDALCNPTGAKTPPSSPSGPYFSTKTIAIHPDFRGQGGPFLSVLTRLTRHAANDLGGRFGWRRSNKNNRAIRIVQKHAEITHVYRLYRLGI